MSDQVATGAAGAAVWPCLTGFSVNNIPCFQHRVPSVWASMKSVIYWLLLVIYWPYFLIYWFLLLLAPLRRKHNLPGLMGNPVATHCWEHGHASLGFSQRKYFVYQHRMYIHFLDFFKRNMWTAMKDHTLARSLTSTSPNNLVGEPAWPPPTQRGAYHSISLKD